MIECHGMQLLGREQRKRGWKQWQGELQEEEPLLQSWLLDDECTATLYLELYLIFVSILKEKYHTWSNSECYGVQIVSVFLLHTNDDVTAISNR